MTGARAYDPITARYLSVDPLISTDTPTWANPYTYAAANPVTLTDPEGLEPRPWHDPNYDPSTCANSNSQECHPADAEINGGTPGTSANPGDPDVTSTSADTDGDHWITPVEATTAGMHLYHGSESTDSLHTALAGLGMIPLGGEIFDITDAALYLHQGDNLGAGLAAAGAIPIAGWLSGTTRLLTKTSSKAAKGGDGLLSPGPFAGRSIPGDATRDFTRTQRDQLNQIMRESGCHRCGAKSPGTKSGDAIPDHQPPLSQSEGPFQLYPHCLTCSREQGLHIANLFRRGGAQ